MSTPQPLSYMITELNGHLPAGWGLSADGSGTWDARRGVWSIEIYDSADMTWKLAVTAAAAAKSGRLEALRQAIDQISREALG